MNETSSRNGNVAKLAQRTDRTFTRSEDSCENGALETMRFPQQTEVTEPPANRQSNEIGTPLGTHRECLGLEIKSLHTRHGRPLDLKGGRRSIKRADRDVRLRRQASAARLMPARQPTLINQTSREYFRNKKMAELHLRGPASIFVFLDEHSASIGGGVLMVSRGYPPGNGHWRNLLASYHNGAFTFSFADGHGELHKWLETSGANKTMYPLRMGSTPSAQQSNYNQPDFTSRDSE